MKKTRRTIAFLTAVIILCLMLPVQAARIEGTIQDNSVTNWQYINNYADSDMYIDTSGGDRAIMVYFNGGYEFWSPGQTRNCQLVTGTKQLKKDTLYCFEFQAKALNAHRVYMQYGWGARVNLTPGLSTYDWTTFRITYYSDADAGCGIRFIIEEQTDGFWLNNAKFYAIDEPEINLLPNGDIEQGGGKLLPEKNNAEEEISGATQTSKKNTMFAEKMTPVIDGKDDEWGNAEVVPVALKGKILDLEGGLSGGEVRLAYDDTYLYFFLDVFDTTHYAVPTSKYWENDGIQYNTANIFEPDTTHVESGAFLYDDGSGVYQSNQDHKIAIVREGNVTKYEVAYPWTTNFNGKAPETMLFNLALNNNDGEGRDYAYEITNGIVFGGKNPYLFNPLVLWRNVGEVKYGVITPTKVGIGVEDCVEIDLLNDSDVMQTVDLSIAALDYSNKVTLEPQSKKQIKIPFTVTEEEDLHVVVEITSNDETVKSEGTVKVNVVRDASTFPMAKAKLESYRDEIKELILKCQEKKIEVEYERAGYSIIDMFIDFAQREVDNGDYSRIYQYEKELKMVYEECKNNLEAYLEGSKKTKHVSKYLTGEIKLDGTSVIGKTETNGKIEEKPVFLIGYCTWETGPKAIPQFSSIGATALQFEAQMKDYIGPVRGGGWNMGGRNDNGVSEVQITSTTEDAVSGKYSMKVVNPGKPIHNVFRTLAQPITVKPNTTYEYGFKAKGKGMREQAKANDTASCFCNLNGIYSGIRSGVVNSEEWRDYNFEYTTNNAETALEFLFVFQDLITELYIDDVYVREKGTEENLIFNSDFEYYPKASEVTDIQKEAEKLGWYINYLNLNNLKSTLKRAEQHNVAIDLISSPSHLPDLVVNSDPAIREAGRTEQFLSFPLDNSTMRTATRLFASLFAEVAKESKAVVSLCLMNEPKLFANQGEYYIPHWQKFLRERYENDIAKLNKTYGSNYKSFEEVKMPGGIQGSPEYTDYRDFNDATFAEFTKWYVDEVKKVNPDLLVHSKIMQYLRAGNYHSYYSQGTNFEIQAHLQDVSGHDGWGGVGALPGKMAWCDMMTSLADKPVWNTEDHNVGDGTPPKYPDDEPYWSAADTWNECFHGLGMSAIWLWEMRNNIMPWAGSASSVSNPNAVHKPLRVWETTKTTYDVNRLSREVTAVQKAEKKVGLLYSRIATAYNGYFVANTVEAYKDILYSGQKVGFVCDATPEDMHKYDLYVITGATNVKKDMLENIKKYIQNGGKVVIVGEDCLLKDEYNRPHDKELVDYIYKHAEIGKDVKDKIYEMKLSDVVLVNAETGERIDNIEWAYAEYNNKIVVNMLNYDYDVAVPIKILYKGKEITSFSELRSMTYNHSSYLLEPYKPILVQFNK